MKSSIQLLALLMLTCLAGCSIEVLHHTSVDFLVLSEDRASFLATRFSETRTSGADWETSKTLGARAEYYSIPLDFSLPEIKVEPAFAVERQGPSRMVVNPQNHTIEKEYIDPPVLNAQFFPGNRGKVIWTQFGKDAYAYANKEEETLSFARYSGERCSIDLKPFGYRDYVKNGLWLMLSNDGHNVSVVKRGADGAEVNVYEGCASVAHHSFALSKELHLRNLCAAKGKYWYIAANKVTGDVIAQQYQSQAQYILPKSITRGDGVEGEPVFECSDSKFYWLSKLFDSTKDRGTTALHQYDPINQQHRRVKLYLGKALY